jgi:ubiquitin C-terminal hydrolase
MSHINYNYLLSNDLLNKYTNRGLSGLCNLGNTCYINSCLQILSHCYELHELINIINTDSNTNTDSNIKNLILQEWTSLKDLMWSKNCVISPNRFLNAIQHIATIKDRELFSGYVQNDLPEFLIFLFDCFHEALERKVTITINGNSENNIDELAKKCYTMIQNMYSNSYSEIIDLFFGIHVSLIISNNDSNNDSNNSTNSKEILSITPEPFSIINLPIPHSNTNNQEFSIYDCFNLYTQPEFLEGENAWFNETTNSKENVNKCIKFWSLPNILIVDFKRFNNANKKLNNVIKTPLLGLDMSKYVVGYNRDKYIYELFGICNHSGECLGGHYSAYVKNSNQKWYHYNDTNVDEISESQLITPKGYCYFYRKLL